MGMVRAVQTLMMVQKGMNAVQAIFNVLLMANPIGLVIAAIGILIGVFIILYKKCEGFRNAVNGLFERLKGFVNHVIEIFTPAFEVFKGVWDKLINTFGEIGGSISRVFSLFSGLFSKADEGTASFSLLDAVMQTMSITLQIIGTLLGGLVDTVGALFGGINDIIDAFSNGGFVAGIKQIGISLLDFVLTPIKAVLEAISHIPKIGGFAKAGLDKLNGFTDMLSVETERNTDPGGTGKFGKNISPAPAGLTAATVQPTTPMTPAQQQAYYSRTESSETVNVDVRAMPGTQVRQRGRSRSPNVRVRASGDNF
jgi:hypothetical protein